MKLVLTKVKIYLVTCGMLIAETTVLNILHFVLVVIVNWADFKIVIITTIILPIYYRYLKRFRICGIEYFYFFTVLRLEYCHFCVHFITWICTRLIILILSDDMYYYFFMYFLRFIRFEVVVFIYFLLFCSFGLKILSTIASDFLITREQWNRFHSLSEKDYYYVFHRFSSSIEFETFFFFAKLSTLNLDFSYNCVVLLEWGFLHYMEQFLDGARIQPMHKHTHAHGHEAKGRIWDHKQTTFLAWRHSDKHSVSDLLKR